jgi:hypothetical protein
MAENFQTVAAHSVTEPHHLAQLRKRRNASLGLCKLPAEILGHILKAGIQGSTAGSYADVILSIMRHRVIANEYQQETSTV